MKTKKPLLYRIGRCILGPIFKLYYRPKILNKENLNVDGSAIVAGNHIHLYDQCHTIISTKKIITFMAKKEYFDNKKTAWFFKSVGCIPVDRTKKDENAVSHALDVLNSGSYIGIFPEGTRNALKDERIKELYEDAFKDIDYDLFYKKIKENDPKLSQLRFLVKLYKDNKISKDELNSYIYEADDSLRILLRNKVITLDEYLESNLLELKFGAVSMAKKTNSYLIPVMITGEYKHHSKNLKVNYGKPFKVDEMELVDANNKLLNELKELMKENLSDELEL